MMATTHIVAGLFVASVVSLFTDLNTSYLFISGFIGGFLPDIDMFFTHRRTTHFPVYSALLAVLSTLMSILTGNEYLIIFSVLTISFALHCLMDIYGGTLEPRPWERNTKKAIYSHWHSRWVDIRNGVKYDGSPYDLALFSVLAILTYLITTYLIGSVPYLQITLLILAIISIVYTIIRKPIVKIGEILYKNKSKWYMIIPESILPQFEDLDSK